MAANVAAWREGIRGELAGRVGLVAGMGDDAVAAIADVVAGLVECLRAGGVVYACGNGGSATQAAHFTAELVGRYRRERRSLPAFTLADNAAVVTALSNDYAFEDVFARQIAGLGKPGDCLLALSTSGNSPNVVRACRAAAEHGLRVFGVTGQNGGEMVRHCHVTIAVPATDTPLVQELHLVVVHILCQFVEAALFPA